MLSQFGGDDDGYFWSNYADEENVKNAIFCILCVWNCNDGYCRVFGDKILCF